jgi:DDE superfamily endonuclease
VRAWLTAAPDPAFQAKCTDIWEVYHAAATAALAGLRTVSIDEMTGIQALGRGAPGLPLRPGAVERREFEYVRHGTQTLIAGFDVASGQVVGRLGDHRGEGDFAAFLEHLLDSAGPDVQWEIVADNLNIHLSESVVRVEVNGSSPTTAASPTTWAARTRTGS